MSKEKINKEEMEEPVTAAETTTETEATTEEPKEEPTDTKADGHKHKKEKKGSKSEKITELEQQLGESKDKYIRLSAEFDNYRKRTLKEKMELTKTAGESILVNILPVIDDFERAMESFGEETEDTQSLREGIDLIYNKFSEYLKQNGIKAIDAKEQEFNTDLHEALTKIPAPTEELKGKVVDVIQKGYFLHDKVIRYAKVVVGE